MTSMEKKELIAQYKDGYDEVIKSLEAFPEDGIASHPIRGKWSALRDCSSPRRQ